MYNTQCTVQCIQCIFKPAKNDTQDGYDKTALELAKTKDLEVKLKDDLERAHFDLEMVRERFDKASVRCTQTGTAWGGGQIQLLRYMLIRVQYRALQAAKVPVVTCMIPTLSELEFKPY